MSGIVGSKFNHRGSGLIGSLGTDGQIFTSSGAGASAVFETAAGGAAILSIAQTAGPTSRQSISSVTSFEQPSTNLKVTVTPQSADSKFLLIRGSGCVRNLYCTWYRDSTNLGHTDDGFQALGADQWVGGTFMYLDSPATTSEIVYSFQLKTGGASSTGYIINENEAMYMQCIEIDLS